MAFEIRILLLQCFCRNGCLVWCLHSFLFTYNEPILVNSSLNDNYQCEDFTWYFLCQNFFSSRAVLFKCNKHQQVDEILLYLCPYYLFCSSLSITHFCLAFFQVVRKSVNFISNVLQTNAREKQTKEKQKLWF